MPQPSHRKKQFTAQRHFTDREEARQTFWRALKAPQRTDEYRVQVFYGVGGQGKTALCEEFLRMLREEYSVMLETSQHRQFGWATVDFESPRYRVPDEALLSLRLQLRETAGVRFPAFDFAYTRYFTLAYPGTNIRERHPELFRGENEDIENIIGLAGELADKVPGLGLLYKYGKRLSDRFSEWWERSGREVLQDLDHLKPFELQMALSKFLGADICEALDSPDGTADLYTKKRVVILLDTYEALWRDHNLKTGLGALRVDEWVRRLVEETPGVLFVLFGRDELQWAELGDDWQQVLSQYPLDGLSGEDADAFLQAIPIPEQEIRQTIIAAAKGLPFYLDLQVDTYEAMKNKKATPTPQHFGDEEVEVIARFLSHLDRHDEMVLKVLAHPRRFDEVLFNYLCDQFLGGSAAVSFARIMDHSCFKQGADGSAVMHMLMRDYLVARTRREEPLLAKQIHDCLFAWYDQRANVDDYRDLTSTVEKALEEAGYHLAASDPGQFPGWCIERAASFEKAARYSLLIPLYTQAWELGVTALGPEHPNVGTTLNNLAGLYHAQGQYDKAEPLYTQALEICKKVFGPEHPHVATTLNNLVGLYHDQGQYEKAEPLYTQALEILKKVLGPEHPDVGTTLNSLAGLYHAQGQYEKAEPLLTQALEICKKVFGPEHPHVGATLNSLAELYRAQGQYDKAEPLLTQALEIRKKVFGPEHPHVATATFCTR